jgi:CRISPR/Cas system CSM-associated protein Csm2 small subunit
MATDEKHQHEKTIKFLKERDKDLRENINKLKNKHKEKNDHAGSELAQLKKQLTSLKWMLQLYQNKTHVKDEEHYQDFEKIAKLVGELIDDVAKLKKNILE